MYQDYELLQTRHAAASLPRWATPSLVSLLRATVSQLVHISLCNLAEVHASKHAERTRRAFHVSADETAVVAAHQHFEGEVGPGDNVLLRHCDRSGRLLLSRFLILDDDGAEQPILRRVCRYRQLGRHLAVAGRHNRSEHGGASRVYHGEQLRSSSTCARIYASRNVLSSLPEPSSASTLR